MVEQLSAAQRQAVVELVVQTAMGRLGLSQALGQTSHELQRDYYETLGYEPKPDVRHFLQRYQRQDLAGRVVDLPAQDTWKHPPAVVEDPARDTEFEGAWATLTDRVNVWAALSRADRLAGIGRFGILLLGFADVAAGSVEGEPATAAPLSQAVEPGALSGPDGLLYLHPYSEDRVSIEAWEENASSERYGQPLTYAVRVREEGQPLTVHWSRVLHLADNKLDSEVYGTPRLQRVYNRLDDLIKLVGGGAEAAWLQMRPGTLITNKPDYQFPQDDDSKAAWDEEVRRYAHDILRFIKLEGADVQQIGPSDVPDTSAQFEACIGLISAASGIPQRVLLGSAAGELAAAEWDYRQWAGAIAVRQSAYAEPEVLRALIARLQVAGVLPPTPQGYHIGELYAGQWRWPSIITPTDSEIAEIMLRHAQAERLLSDPSAAYLSNAPERRVRLGYPAEDTPRDALAGNMARNQASPFIPTTADEDVDEQLRRYVDDLAALANSAQANRLPREQFEQQLARLVASYAVAIYLAGVSKRVSELSSEDWLEIREFEQANFEAVSGLANDIYIAGRFTSDAGQPQDRALSARLTLWAISGMALGVRAIVRSDTERNYRWELGGTIEHCTDCLRLDGQVHSGDEWLASGWLPQVRRLQCGGWNCDCRLVPTRSEARGSF